MRAPKLFVALLGLTCCLLFTLTANAQIIHGNTTADYDAPSNTIIVNSETIADYDLGPYYEPFLELRIYKDNVLIDQPWAFGGGSGASITLQYTATPGSMYYIYGYHNVNCYLWEFDEFDPFIVNYFDDFWFGRFENQNIYTRWYYPFAAAPYQRRVRRTQGVPLGGIYSYAQAVIPQNVSIPSVTASGATKVSLVVGNQNILHFVTPKGSSGSKVTLTATISPDTTANREMVTWEGATPNPSNPLQATVPKDAASKKVVKIKLNGVVAKELRVWVVWATKLVLSHILNL